MLGKAVPAMHPTQLCSTFRVAFWHEYKRRRSATVEGIVVIRIDRPDSLLLTSVRTRYEVIAIIPDYSVSLEMSQDSRSPGFAK